VDLSQLRRGDLPKRNPALLPAHGHQIHSLESRAGIKQWTHTDGTYAYYHFAESFWRVSLEGGSAVELRDVGPVRGVDADGQHLYWTRFDNVLRRMRLSGSEPEQITGEVRHFVVGDEFVYFIRPDETVARIAK
jgi:hypothetical protein